MYCVKKVKDMFNPFERKLVMKKINLIILLAVLFVGKSLYAEEASMVVSEPTPVPSVVNSPEPMPEEAVLTKQLPKTLGEKFNALG